MTIGLRSIGVTTELYLMSSGGTGTKGWELYNLVNPCELKHVDLDSKNIFTQTTLSVTCAPIL